jgi:hypothetical protein
MRELCTMTAFLNNGFVKWLLVPLVVLGLLGWYAIHRLNAPFPVCTFRYKLTAEVMTPDGLKTGSSVIEVSYSHHGDYGGGENAVLNIVGEAVYVDLGAGKNLFVTLTTRDSGRAGPNDRNGRNYYDDVGPMNPFAFPLKVYGLKWQFGHEADLCGAFRSVDPERIAEVSFENIPTLVSFGNLADPNSVNVVQPAKLSDVFGNGYELKRLFFWPTTDPQVAKIENILKWLPQMKQRLSLKPGYHGPEQSNIDRLYYDAFKSPGIESGASL